MYKGVNQRGRNDGWRNRWVGDGGTGAKMRFTKKQRELIPETRWSITNMHVISDSAFPDAVIEHRLCCKSLESDVFWKYILEFEWSTKTGSDQLSNFMSPGWADSVPNAVLEVHKMRVGNVGWQCDSLLLGPGSLEWLLHCVCLGSFAV